MNMMKAQYHYFHLENFKICRGHYVADSNGIFYSPFLWDLEQANAIGLIKCQQASSGLESTKGKRKMDRPKLTRCSSNDAETRGDEKTCAKLKISQKHVSLRGVVSALLFPRDFGGLSLVKEWHCFFFWGFRARISHWRLPSKLWFTIPLSSLTDGFVHNVFKTSNKEFWKFTHHKNFLLETKKGMNPKTNWQTQDKNMQCSI